MRVRVHNVMSTFMGLLINGNTHLRFIKAGITLCGRCVMNCQGLTDNYDNTGWADEQNFNEIASNIPLFACMTCIINKYSVVLV